MDIFLMVRRKKLTIFLDAKENTSVYDVKRMIEGITKRKPEEQMLYKDDGSGKWDTPLGNDKFLADYNLNASTAKAQLPATLGLSFLAENGQFEQLEITPLSVPPELPDSMKPTESQGIEQSN
ncbi:hypothetical protein RDWZM_003766 [Blomia tropicalis]|uniref:Transcription elongation factor B polypeptide 2 n=1 Tax=Blomia tropicalis TaxID=40697 RepID=A0A9Q0RTC2_BLOTA|nr:Ubiquitin [Blomia tropicalis]KAJ6225221.1 hypothetical protein RDWZM_003766 [Blomia tropicalis]